MPRIGGQQAGIGASIHRPITIPIDNRLRDWRGESIASAVLTGEDEAGLIVTTTTDTTPELRFNWPGAAPATITLEGPDGVGGRTSYGPFAVVGNNVDIAAPLLVGLYTVTSQAQNSEGVTSPIGGSLEIISLQTAYGSLLNVSYGTRAGVAYGQGN